MDNTIIPDPCVTCIVVMLLLFCVNVALRWMLDRSAKIARERTDRFAREWRERMDEQYGRGD